MPFQSEKQRRYLWANEPEIARDWADTYGSRIESNTGGISRLGFANGNAATGGIMRLGYANGPITDDYGNTYENRDPLYKDLTVRQFNERFGGMDYQVTEEEKVTGEQDQGLGALNFLKKMFAPQNLTQDQRDMNNQFLASQGIGFMPNNPYQMVGGPFSGMNAPGTSAFGSATSQEMAQKWMDKYGGMKYTTPKMQQKQQTIKNIATMNEGPPGINTGSGDEGQHTTQGKSTSGYQPGGHHFNRGGIVDLWRR